MSGIEQRFWAKVNKDGPIPEHCTELGPCWIWTASKGSHGYGQLMVGSRKNGTKTMACAHVLSWKLHFGETGMWVLHHCDNRSCVNPTHLFLGTSSDNVKDGIQKQLRRFARGEENGLSVLNPGIVKTIRSRYEVGDISQRALAKELGISRSTLRGVVEGDTWRHV